MHILQERRGSSSHPCSEILCCLPLEDGELFSKGMEVRIKLLVELRDEGETQEGETFLPEKSHTAVRKHSMRNMTSPISQLSVLSLEFAFSPPTLFPFLTLFILSFLVLLSSFQSQSGRDGLAFHGLSEQVWGVSGVLCRNWLIFANQNFALSWKLH